MEIKNKILFEISKSIQTSIDQKAILTNLSKKVPIFKNAKKAS